MTGFLVSKRFIENFGDRFAAAAQSAGIEPRLIHIPPGADSRLTQPELEAIGVAYLSRDLRFSDHFPAFGDSVSAAPNLKWVHFASTGISQYAWLQGLIDRGVKVTTSVGANGEPVGEIAICAMLMLARRFPRWLDSQRRHAWEPMRGAEVPRDLKGQTIVIVGVGTIGATLARFCRAIGMHVIGVRRSPKRDDDPVDEMHPLSEFPKLLPRAHWVVLACPHTSETQHLLNARTLAMLPDGAYVMNVARGEIADEPALIGALQSGRLGGAYLDVFDREPLPPDSPLWGIPNVIVTPHNAQASAGNETRAFDIFAENLERLERGDELRGERHA
ncbi:MAG TPA: D-2-hydroxyacid dehydrogenase [Burkholderiales bacterium]|nr:D-2-hydroxyacid dehydrogenase [Burkholderiales bacterium]